MLPTLPTLLASIGLALLPGVPPLDPPGQKAHRLPWPGLIGLASNSAHFLTGRLAMDPQESPATDRYEQTRPEWIQLMREGILTAQPNASFTLREGRSTLFSGSYDWHSCVIAYWALLVQARVDGDARLQRWVLDRLPIHELVSEAEALRLRERQHEVSYPYDEAWFAVLLAEWCKHNPGEAELLTPDRKMLEARLLRTLEAAPFPELVSAPMDDPARFCGFYRSSLFLCLLIRWSQPVTEGALERLLVWENQNLEPHLDEIDSLQVGHGYDFLWLPAILDLNDQAADRSIQRSVQQVDLTDPWPKRVSIRTVHRLGRELSRTWTLAALAQQGDADADLNYRKRVTELLERREFWAEDFKVCSHWIPQYLFIGHWIRSGRP